MILLSGKYRIAQSFTPVALAFFSSVVLFLLISRFSTGSFRFYNLNDAGDGTSLLLSTSDWPNVKRGLDDAATRKEEFRHDSDGDAEHEKRSEDDKETNVDAYVVNESGQHSNHEAIPKPPKSTRKLQKLSSAENDEELGKVEERLPPRHSSVRRFPRTGPGVGLPSNLRLVNDGRTATAGRSFGSQAKVAALPRFFGDSSSKNIGSSSRSSGSSSSSSDRSFRDRRESGGKAHEVAFRNSRSEIYANDEESDSVHDESLSLDARSANDAQNACPMGSACDTCTQNHFGPDCKSCPRCSSAPGEFQGRCDDGQLGKGFCTKAADAGRPAFAQCHDLTKPCPVEFHQAPGDLIMTTIFTSKPDPQRPHRPNCSVSDTSWYTSVKSLRLSALVLHDCLSGHDVLKLQSHHVRFLYVDMRDDMSVNDFRFIVYYGVLSGQVRKSIDVPAVQVNAKWTPTVRRVFLTDMLDVRFTGDPFDLIYGSKYHLYVGNEDGAPTSPPSGGWNWWMKQLAFNCSGWDADTVESHKTKMSGYLLNAGIVGGTVSPVLSLLRLMSLHMLSSRMPYRARNCDMFILNKCIHDLFAIESVFTGYPLHSAYKREESPSSAYIVHK